MKKTILMLIFLCTCTSCFGLVSDIGLDPLDQSAGARPLGMGGAYVGLSDDMNAMFYNPAGISKVRGFTASVRGLKDYSLGIAYDTQIGNFGLGVVSSLSEVLNVGTPEMSYDNSLILLTYGVDLGDISVGLTAKSLLTQKIAVKGATDLVSSGGADMDLGLIWRPLEWLSLGTVAHNLLQTKYTLESTEEAFPGVITGGLSINLLGDRSVFYNDTFGLILAYDGMSGKYGTEQKPGSSYGAELSLWKWLYLRGGGGSRFFNGKDVSYSSGGIGFRNGDFTFDLATTQDPYTDSQISFVSIMYLPPKTMVYQFVPEAGQVAPAPEIKRELLTVRFPPDAITVYEDRISIEGEANPKAQVMINGALAYVYDDWKYSVIQPVRPGKNLIVIEANLNGERVKYERRVFRRAKVIIAEEVGLNKKYAIEVQKKEQDLKKMEEDILKAKQRGQNVSAKEKELTIARNALENKKQEITKEKLTLEERKGKVENLVTLGVIEVAPQTSFKIETPIKRGEMITWLVKAAGLPIPILTGPVCADVPQDNPDAPYIKATLDAGLIRLPPNNRFRPNDPVTDEEGQVFFKAFGVVK